MKKRMPVLIALLAVAVSAVCSFCRRQECPQVPPAARQDIRPVQTKEVATPSAPHTPLRRDEADQKDVSAAVAVVCGRDAVTADRYEERMNQEVKQ